MTKNMKYVILEKVNFDIQQNQNLILKKFRIILVYKKIFSENVSTSYNFPNFQAKLFRTLNRERSEVLSKLVFTFPNDVFRE